MPSELLARGIVNWTPNTSQVVQLFDGSYAATILDSEYPAITSTKQLSGVASCRTRAAAQLARYKYLTGSASVTSTGTLGKLSTGKEYISGIAQCEASTPRAALTGAAGPASFDVPSDSVTATSGTAALAVGRASNNANEHLAVRVPTDNSGIFLDRFSTAGTLLGSTTVAVPGNVHGTVTLTTTQISWGTTSWWDIDDNDVIHFVWAQNVSATSANLFYWRSDTGERVLVNTPASAQPPFNNCRPFVICSSTSQIHIIYGNYFRAGGNDYYGLAMITRNGTTWTAAARIIPNTWTGFNSAASVSYAQLHWIDATDRTKIYLYAYTSLGFGVLGWVNLTSRTSGQLANYNVTTNQGSPAHYTNAVWEVANPGEVYVRGYNATFNRETSIKIAYTLAAWTSPTITTSTLTTFSLSNFMKSIGRVFIGGVLYHVNYNATFNGAVTYVQAQYRAVTSTSADTYGATITISTPTYTGSAGFGSVYCSSGYALDDATHVLLVYFTATDQRVVIIRWAEAGSSFSVHLLGQLTAEVTVLDADLNVINVGATVELDGSLLSASTGSLNLNVGSQQQLAASISALTTATLTELRTSSVQMSATLTAATTSLLNLKVINHKLESLAAGNVSASLSLTRTGIAQLAASAAGLTTTTLWLANERRMSGSGAAISSASASVAVGLLLRGFGFSLSSASASLLVGNRLSGSAQCVATALLALDRTVDADDNGVAAFTKQDQTYAITKEDVLWKKTR